MPGLEARIFACLGPANDETRFAGPSGQPAADVSKTNSAIALWILANPAEDMEKAPPSINIFNQSLSHRSGAPVFQPEMGHTFVIDPPSSWIQFWSQQQPMVESVLSEPHRRKGNSLEAATLPRNGAVR